MVSIIVAFKKQTDAANIRNLLTRFGYNVVGVCTSGGAVLNLIDQMIDSDGIIICGCRLSDMDCFNLYKYMPEYYEMVIMGSQAVSYTHLPDYHRTGSRVRLCRHTGLPFPERRGD